MVTDGRMVSRLVSFSSRVIIGKPPKAEIQWLASLARMRVHLLALIIANGMPNVGIDGSLDDAPELAEGAGLVLEVIPPMRALAEEREGGADGEIRGPQAQGLPGVAALVGKDLASAGQTRRPHAGPAEPAAQTPTRHLDGPLARGRLGHLLVQHLLGEVTAH